MFYGNGSTSGIFRTLYAWCVGIFGLAPLAEVRELRSQVDELQQLWTVYQEQQSARNEFTLRVILLLKGRFEELIGGIAQPTQIEGESMSFVLAPVHCIVNAFQGTVRLAPSVSTHQEIPALELRFKNNSLTTDDLTMLLGYVTRLTREIPRSEFWPEAGSKVA